MKLIDPDGREPASRYFRPEHEPERRASIPWMLIRVLLWRLKYYAELSAQWNNFCAEHEYLGQLFAGLGSIGLGAGFTAALKATILASAPTGPLGIACSVLALCLVILIDWVADKIAKFWSNDTFRDLFETLEMYADQLAEGYDCDQEYRDTIVELIVTAYIIEYGDEWRDHCPQRIQDYYDEMQEKKNQEEGNSGDGSGDSPSDSSPPDSSSSNAPPGNTNHSPFAN